MDITGSYRFEASPDRVWKLLMDPVVIASCIPGCQELTAEGEDRYRAKLNVALSAVTGTYDGAVAISEKNPPASYRLTVEGQGKPGFVRGSAAITLRADGAATVVDVHGTVQTGGPIARLGQRLIAGVARMMQDRFFADLQTKL
jgi:carbon monoxide dehydrogenase subunit G